MAVGQLLAVDSCFGATIQTGCVAGQSENLFGGLSRSIKQSARLLKCSCVGMAAGLEQLQRRRLVDDLSGLHYDETAGNIAGCGEIMGYEKCCELKLFLQVENEVQNLRLNRRIQSADRLVEQNEFRLPN